jgi:hypothetical protein
VLVQKPGDLPSQLGRVQQLAQGTCRIKQLAPEFRGDGVPLHDDRGAETAKDMLLFRGKRDMVGQLLTRRLKRLVEIGRQPRFVVSL